LTETVVFKWLNISGLVMPAVRGPRTLLNPKQLLDNDLSVRGCFGEYEIVSDCIGAVQVLFGCVWVAFRCRPG
jgi:hypothetical protein